MEAGGRLNPAPDLQKPDIEITRWLCLLQRNIVQFLFERIKTILAPQEDQDFQLIYDQICCLLLDAIRQPFAQWFDPLYARAKVTRFPSFPQDPHQILERMIEGKFLKSEHDCVFLTLEEFLKDLAVLVQDKLQINRDSLQVHNAVCICANQPNIGVSKKN
jgi:hypothetical protein